MEEDRRDLEGSHGKRHDEGGGNEGIRWSEKGFWVEGRARLSNTSKELLRNSEYAESVLGFLREAGPGIKDGSAKRG